VREAHVLIPAHNEELLIGRCLTSVRLAAGGLAGIRTHVTVMLDTCTDRTADRVRQFPEVDAVEVRLGSVGGARAAAIERIRELHRGRDPRSVWVASTDADSQVPPHWLTRQLDLARGGAELVLGTVRPDPADLDPVTHSLWHLEHRGLRDRVHGANLGFTFDACLRVGGYPAVELHEDVLLMRAMRATGIRVVCTDTTEVVTSGRRLGRVSNGFAGYLRRLGESPDTFAKPPLAVRA
jgi:glycosyltransferase involved in cell wall biosynthesis